MSATTVAAAPARVINRGTLGTLWIIYGLLRLVVAVLLAVFSPEATVMFGALLTRVAEAFTFMAIFHVFYVLLIIVTVLSGIFSLLAGSALLASRPAARRLALTASFFSVADPPAGTTLGIYTLILFLR